MSKKVLNHPEKEEIIKKLLSGDSVKEVERWLKKKHPRTKRLHVSYMTLQKFRSEHLNLKGEVLEDIKDKRHEVDRESKEAEAKMIISSSSSYMQKIEEIATTELDVSKRLIEMDSLINSRIEYYFNLLQQGGTIREDKVFIEYINTMKSIMQDWKKYIEGFADKKIEHNININVVNEQAKILKEAVLDVLQEMNPDLIPVFLDKLEVKMDDVDLGSSSHRGNIIDVN
tara:strand:+ start:5180 stop:5863 length:684 start_codon:yes stop_codon:yes gene_type:complete